MATRATLTREDWIDAAQRTLVKSGVDAVRVDVLAKELQITRGSFYHHFNSRDELLDGLLAQWRIRATERVITQLTGAYLPVRDQLVALLELPLHGNRAQEAASIEIGIRAWARRDARARQAIDEVDSHRLRYIEGLLTQLGGADSEARDRARLIYGYQLSLSLINAESSDLDEERNATTARIAKIVLPSLFERAVV